MIYFSDFEAGSPSFGEGSYEFDASDDYIELSSTPVTAVPATIACWFYPNSVNFTQAVVAIGDAGGVSRLQLDKRAGSPDIGAASVNSGGTSAVQLSGDMAASVWQHSAAVFASTTSRKAYLDGISDGTNTTSNTVSGLDSILIGARYSTTRGAFFGGRIAHVGIWNIALSDGEIASLAAGAHPQTIQAANLVFYAPLTDGVAEDVITSTALTVSGAFWQSDGPF